MKGLCDSWVRWFEVVGGVVLFEEIELADLEVFEEEEEDLPFDSGWERDFDHLKC